MAPTEGRVAKPNGGGTAAAVPPNYKWNIPLNDVIFITTALHYLLYEIFGEINNWNFERGSNVVRWPKSASVKYYVKCINDVRHVQEVPSYFAVTVNVTESYGSKTI